MEIALAVAAYIIVGIVVAIVITIRGVLVSDESPDFPLLLGGVVFCWPIVVIFGVFWVLGFIVKKASDKLERKIENW
jgi:hypothetical protein